jgi:hypothetical protein
LCPTACHQGSSEVSRGLHLAYPASCKNHSSRLLLLLLVLVLLLLLLVMVLVMLLVSLVLRVLNPGLQQSALWSAGKM